MKKTVSRQLLAFLDKSPSCYHAVENLRRQLLEQGYEPLKEFQPWTLQKGGKYFVERGESSLIAFRIPQTVSGGFMLAAAHSDSPSYKVREEAETVSAGGCVRLSVEPYGGMIARSWMDRPLSVAGRVMVREENRIVSRLVNIDRDLLIIPSLAIHLNREVNQGTALKANKDLMPLFACGSETGKFRGMLAEELGVAQEDILSTELFLYPRMTGTLVGAEEEFVASPRLDDLQSVFGCFCGFLAAKESESIPVMCVFNNEEVGSGTRQGADSTFLTDVLERVAAALGIVGEDYRAMVANSFMVSADNAHAMHPSYPEYSDANEHPVLNGGIVVKYNANQKYTTDAVSSAVFAQICSAVGVKTQRYSNRADLPGGSTLGNICNAHLSIPTIDIGMPQLAMHSACEVAGTGDTDDLIRVMTEFFGRSFRYLAEGGVSV